jgi:tyrosyl-tRNA synthetase
MTELARDGACGPACWAPTWRGTSRGLAVMGSASGRLGKRFPELGQQLVLPGEHLGEDPARGAHQLGVALASGALHPMEAKKQLGHRIVELYHGSRAADAAQQAFEHTHQQGGQPDIIPEVPLHGPVRLADLLVSIGAASTKSDARRLIAGRGVRLNGHKASYPDLVIDTAVTIKVGSRRFYRITFN